MKKINTTLAIIFFFLSTIGLLILSNKIERMIPEYRSFIAIFMAFFLGGIFLFISNLILKRFEIKARLNSLKDFFKGSLIGCLVFTISVTYLYVFGYEFNTEKIVISEILNEVLFQFRPAIV